MKNTAIRTLGIALSVIILSAATSLAGKKKTEESDTGAKGGHTTAVKTVIVGPDGKVQELKAGEDLEIVINRALKDASVGAAAESEGKGKGSNVVVNKKTVVVGGDGTVEELEGGEKIADIIQSTLKGLGLDAAAEPSEDGTVVMKSTMVIGPDGSVKELGEGEDLGEVLSEVLGNIDIEVSAAGSKVIGIGPGMLQKIDEDADDKILKEIDELRKELRAQRKLLESIAEKLK